MGPAYNIEIYSRRIEVLTRSVTRHIDQPAEDLRILDVGCGSGFYTEFWKAHSVRDYTGLDISANSVNQLSGQYPEFRFVQTDITADQFGLRDSEPFDVITVFDVLYHIVDEQRFESAVSTIANHVREDGHVMVMDHLCRNDYQLSRHVRYRARERYLAAFQSRNLFLVENELLFHFLVPPITEIRFIDYLSAAAFKAMGLALRRFDGPSAWVARRLRRMDNSLRARGKCVSNSELLVFRKKAKSIDRHNHHD
ncbi:MAG TPA: class I SAM-dependent methyltransferase [Gammaproteobacteria bacterium]|nr:class I SAM-dependent methyltransferase [Gammaproteobacteria bacterium]